MSVSSSKPQKYTGSIFALVALSLLTSQSALADTGSPASLSGPASLSSPSKESGLQISKGEKAEKPVATKAGEAKDAAKAGESKEPAKNGEKSDKAAEKAPEKTAEKKESKPVPEPVIENVVPVQPETLVEHPSDYLNKNVRFTANFYAYSTLALDYKPALRPSKDFLSFLIYRNNSKVPLSELKLAMHMPKDEKDAQSKLLTELKDGDQVEITAKVFAMALDEPWADVLRLKRLKAAADEKKDKDKDKADSPAGK
jgi:hypothetical protein